jgi:16S rRNA (cytosine967-C5)-methyltransferase
LRWLETGEFPDRMLPHTHPATALIQEIVFGCLRYYGTLTWRIGKLVPRTPDPAAQSFLLVGLYQLFHMDNIPPHAAVHETIEAAKKTLEPARCRFLNAVMRTALRQREQLSKDLQHAPAEARWSHPAFVIQRWEQAMGPERTEALCCWNNNRPSVTLRVFQRPHASRDQLLAMCPPHPANPENFRLAPAGTSVETLPGFAEGTFYVQDPATDLAVALLDPKPGMRVLDACAAPGGKTFACADRMQDKGQIIALDRHLDRLERMRENIARLQFSIIKLQRGDATNPQQLPKSTFDRILLDVPCSNSGVLQRRPDARWRITPERIETMTDVQTRILDATAPLLAPDGVLVYSTCSLEPEENQSCIENWIRKNPTFEMVQTQSSFPPESGMDGAFAAKIIRRKA